MCETLNTTKIAYHPLPGMYNSNEIANVHYKKGVFREMSQEDFFGRLRDNYRECKHLLICVDKI